jgi:hypothetical protein
LIRAKKAAQEAAAKKKWLTTSSSSHWIIVKSMKNRMWLNYSHNKEEKLNAIYQLKASFKT